MWRDLQRIYFDKNRILVRSKSNSRNKSGFQKKKGYPKKQVYLEPKGSGSKQTNLQPKSYRSKKRSRTIQIHLARRRNRKLKKWKKRLKRRLRKRRLNRGRSKVRKLWGLGILKTRRNVHMWAGKLFGKYELKLHLSGGWIRKKSKRRSRYVSNMLWIRWRNWLKRRRLKWVTFSYCGSFGSFKFYKKRIYKMKPRLRCIWYEFRNSWIFNGCRPKKIKTS